MNPQTRAKKAYRIAAAASQFLHRNSAADRQDHPGTPFAFVQTYKRFKSMHDVAVARGYLCEARLRRRLQETLDAIDTETRLCRQSLASEPDKIEPRSIMSELLSLFDEFDEVTFDLTRNRVCCKTEPIELNEVYLGSFSIELDLRYLGRTRCYHVVACDPNKASANDSTSHPHVQSEQLCEGDASLPIRNALESGRLFDFFLIVRQTLQTYNRDSAYVSLEDWDGVECHECGSTVDQSESSRCDDCEHSMCDGCSIGCECCSHSFCDGCTEICNACVDRFCAACLMTCEGCDTDFCSSCLEEGLCNDCTEQKETEAAEAAEIKLEPSVVAVRPDGMVKATVHA